jgi:hypothetical protein
MKRARREQIGFDAIIFQNRAQETQPVILPTIVRTGGADENTEVAQV